MLDIARLGHCSSSLWFPWMMPLSLICGCSGKTALAKAAHKGHHEVVSLLVGDHHGPAHSFFLHPSTGGCLNRSKRERGPS